MNTWKTPGVKSTKSYKHVALIQLSDIRSLFDIASTTCDGKKINNIYTFAWNVIFSFSRK